MNCCFKWSLTFIRFEKASYVDFCIIPYTFLVRKVDLSNCIQVLTYAQQSRERATYEQAALAERMQEFRRQMEHNNQRSFSDVEASPSGDGIHTIGRSSHKMIEAVMQSTPRGKVILIVVCFTRSALYLYLYLLLLMFVL